LRGDHVAALVQVAAWRVESLIALALVVGEAAVRRALVETDDDRPLVSYAPPAEGTERFERIDRLMRERSRGPLGSEV